MLIRSGREYADLLCRDALDVFGRKPRTEEERKHGIKDDRRPDLDWTGLQPLKVDPTMASDQ